MSSILVVESEGLITELLRESLGSQKYKTVTVLNGEDAVQFALREMPLLIIIDTALPKFDSCEAIRLLREHPKSMHVPIIVLSSNNSLADKVRAFELGVDNYILKPLVPEELLAHVRRHLRRVQQSSLSPLTQLPGGLQLERAIDFKVNSLDPWSVLYLDLDNFKAFNDAYGFLAGNHMILLLGTICQQVVYEYGNDDDFIGHVGGDDFVIVTTPDRVPVLCRHILTRYRQESTRLYRQEDLERGTISGLDRKGRAYQFPLVSLSIGIVSNQVRCSYSVDEVGTLAAEAKRHAKQSSSNIYHISSQWRKSTQELPSVSRSAPSSLYDFDSSRNQLFYIAEEDAIAEFK